MSNDGIILHKAFSNWEWYQDSNTVRVFIHCLLNANHEDKKWQGVLIKKGSFVTSYNQLSKELGLSKQQIRTSLKKLTATQYLTQSATHLYTTLKVENWALFQGGTKKDNTVSNTVSNTVATQSPKNSKNNKENTINNNIYNNIYNNTNKDINNTNKKDISNSNNINNKKNKKNKENTILKYSSKEKEKAKEIKHKYGEYKHVLLTDKQFEKLKKDFPNEWKQMIKNLDEYLEMKNVSYKNHNLVMRNWKNKEKKQNRNPKKNDVQIDWLDDYVNEQNLK